MSRCLQCNSLRIETHREEKDNEMIVEYRCLDCNHQEISIWDKELLNARFTI